MLKAELFIPKLLSQVSLFTQIFKPETNWSIKNFSLSLNLHPYSIRQQVLQRLPPDCVMSPCILCQMPPTQYCTVRHYHSPVILQQLPFSLSPPLIPSPHRKKITLNDTWQTQPQTFNSLPTSPTSSSANSPHS